MVELTPERKAAAARQLRAQHIETPSWAYGNSGTRFKVFAQEGVPRTPYEKIDDAATVHRLTGAAPSVRCTSRGTAFNSNVFQDDD